MAETEVLYLSVPLLIWTRIFAGCVSFLSDKCSVAIRERKIALGKRVNRWESNFDIMQHVLCRMWVVLSD